MGTVETLLSEIVRIGKKYGVNKVILFGSRARGDHTAKSDYDIAFVSPFLDTDLKNNIKNELEELDTLHKTDIVFLKDLKREDEFTRNIVRDGVMLMNKYETKFRNFQNAVGRLQEAVDDFDSLKRLSIRDGAIQRFEFTVELAWKTLREYLLEQGCVGINTPKAVMSEAFAADIIDNEKGWIGMINDRNLTSHIYDENEADEIFGRIKNEYLDMFRELLKKLEELQA